MSEDDRVVLLVGPPDWLERAGGALADAALDAVVRSTAKPLPSDAAVVVVGHAPPESDGLATLERVRDSLSDRPVVFHADGRGSERLAAEAVAAGATEYVPGDEDRDSADGDLAAAVRRALSDVPADPADVGRRADQLDALFGDPETFMWTLSDCGRVERTNGAALAAIDVTADAVRGQALWSLPWWPEEEREVVRSAVERATDGERVEVATAIRRGEDGLVQVDLRLWPVSSGGSGGDRAVAAGVDTTERVRLEEELRRSEELHRVTLNNMTDTVLVTDDDGQFTYVCPNVHFIFGYSAEEIRELGTIDELLGSDLFDRETLAERGVLTNVECTAEDRSGEEHTLLVNVREVSIQGGTTLFSCRDVTKRKQRERALTALHRTARRLLYAESRDEIAEVVASDATEALALPATAVYLFDTDENVLRPAVASDGMTGVSGPLVPLEPGEGLVGRAFVEGEAIPFTERRHGERVPPVELRDGVVVPLGERGVFVAGTTEIDVTDEVSRELADLLAATAEAALDRVGRETELRRQDRELKRRNRRLTRLNRINDIIREIDQALVRAETREAVEHAVCERLTAEDRFAFAWIGEATDTDGAAGRLRPRAWAGNEEGYLDEAALDDEREPAARTARTGAPTLVSNVATDLHAEPWRSAALSREYQSAASVPLAYGDVQYGVLTVYAARPRGFDRTAEAVLRELGETVASAISSVERRNALLSEGVTELEYETTGHDCVLLRLARAADCRLELEEGVQQTPEGVRAFVSVTGGPLSRVSEVVEASVAVASVREITSSTDGGLLQVVFSRPFLATTLADHGAVLRGMAAEAGVARFAVDVPTRLDVGTVDEVVTSAHPEAELVAKRDRRLDTPTGSGSPTILDGLTDRQREVLRAAYLSGFFESPRERTGEEVADALGISPAAFYEHVRKVQRTVFAALFEDATG